MATRKMSRKSKMSKSRKGSRKASSWAMTVKKVYAGLKKKMGKISKFRYRPNRTKNEKRRALSDHRSDTKIGLDHILIEASNNTDGEAGDSEMM
jgi:hypothetical protein